MSDRVSTLPIRPPRTAPSSRALPAARRVAPSGRPSLARRRWGFAVAVLLMLGTLPVQLLGLALIGIQVLSPSTDGTEPIFIGGIGVGQLLLLAGVAVAGQLVGGGTDVWRRRMAFACLNALLVVAAAGVGWALLL